MGGLTGELRLSVAGMIKASMGMVDVVMKGARDTTIALGHELGRQKGMAGDDDAGRAFAKAYGPAAAAAIDQMGFSAYVMGATGKALMRTAREVMATDKHIAALMGQQDDLTEGMGDPGKDCAESFLGLGEELPEVVGDTTWYRQYVPGGGDRYRGDAGRVREVAGTWRHAGRLMARLLEDAQVYATTANQAHAGEAATAFDQYFRRTVGFGDPPERAQEDEPLVANLVAACTQLAKACEQYADHIDAALRVALAHKADFFRIDAPWDAPMFGGNGDDGGLHLAVTGDPHIHALGDVAHALDASRGRVTVPGGGPPSPWWHPPMMPALPPLRPVPLLLASAPAMVPMGSRVDPSIPSSDPIPPEPGTTTLLGAADQARFRAWRDALPASGFMGGGNHLVPENAYQVRVAGYPEREVPLPAGVGAPGKGITVDGLRPSDGYAIEAKYVREPDCENPKTFRRLSVVNRILATPPKLDEKGRTKFDPHRDGMFVKDEGGLMRYKAALEYPRNNQIRGFEIITNDKESAPYWQSMMLMTGVKGTARYVP
ncbi:restriction endonuclease fold toxin-2 domain-containing protein [Streptomyces varsoviensis]|nr:restriction endonuclease fold toxin-2 domain-containing protein [Streptomyces varsoviensis]